MGWWGSRVWVATLFFFIGLSTISDAKAVNCKQLLEALAPAKAIVIAGPTTSGKSGAAEVLGRQYGAHVINSDRMFFFRSYRIGTGFHDLNIPEDRKHLYSILDDTEDFYPLDRFIRQVADLINTIHSEGQLAIIEGGSTLYTPAILTASLPVVAFGVKKTIDERLRERIYHRVTQMIEDGLIDETIRLLEAGLEHTPGFQIAVTYPIVTAFLRGQLSRTEMIDQISKRIEEVAIYQLEAMERVEGIDWIDSSNHDAVTIAAEIEARILNGSAP